MICIDVRGQFPNKPFKSLAAKGWNEFFRVADDITDVAHWLIELSGTVRLSARRSTVDETDFEWEGLEPITMLIHGITDRLRTAPREEWNDILHEYRMWVEKGILEAFESPRVKKKAADWGVDKKWFAVVTSESDYGLHEDELSLIWQSNKDVSVAQIKSNQAAAKKKTKPRKGRPVKKKPK